MLSRLHYSFISNLRNDLNWILIYNPINGVSNIKETEPSYDVFATCSLL